MSHIYIASDHAGFALKQALVGYLTSQGHDLHDLGPETLDLSDDYPLLILPCAEAVAKAWSETEESSGESAKTIDEKQVFGIVIGSSGQGEAMVANRVPAIRAAVFYGAGKGIETTDAEGAPAEDGYDIVRLARMHNDANILSLGARFITEEQAQKAVDVFLATPFSTNERHHRRISEF